MSTPTLRLFVSASLLVFTAACNCGSTIDVKEKCSATAACPVGKVCVNGACEHGDGGQFGDGGSSDGGNKDGGNIDAGPTVTLSALTLEPPTAMLVSTNGSKPTQAFAARMTFSDGSSSLATTAIFSNDQEPIGTIDPIAGLFTASSNVGGTVNVKADLTWAGKAFTASGTVSVQLEWVTLDPALTMADVAKFQGTAVVDAAREVNVVYPLNGVLFPQNVAPADVQWLTATNGDIERITLSKPSAKVTAYVLEAGDKHWIPDAGSWRGIAQSDPASPATLTVDRYETATQQVITGTPRTMKFAKAALAGSIYYWDIEAGRIVRIDDGTTNRTAIMPNPPPANDGSRCVGCHTVSSSGRYMSGRLGPGENIGGIFDLTTNLTGDPAPTVWPTSPTTAQWWFSSFSPDETRLVMSVYENSANVGMAFMDPKTGMPVTYIGTPTGVLSHVAWSPDGKTIAYVNGLTGWGGGSSTGNITTIPVLSPTMLGVPTTVHTGSAITGSTADSYPTWSPDSKHLGFANGSGNRSEDSQASLYWMGFDGSGVERLTNASGGLTSTSNFQPRFSPFIADGYYWMSFLSRRDYGNEKVGTRGASRQQIWVAAIKVTGTPGQDPSEVGYWLPGQNTQSRNIAAFWAPRACRQQGDDCSVGSECCSSLCAANATGKLVCSPTPPARCRVNGESCGMTSDCCENKGLVCLQNTCGPGIN